MTLKKGRRMYWFFGLKSKLSYRNSNLKKLPSRTHGRKKVSAFTQEVPGSYLGSNNSEPMQWEMTIFSWKKRILSQQLKSNKDIQLKEVFNTRAGLISGYYLCWSVGWHVETKFLTEGSLCLLTRLDLFSNFLVSWYFCNFRRVCKNCRVIV